MKFTILEDNMEKLEKRMVKIGNFCSKHDLPFSYSHMGEHFETHKNVLNGEEVTVKLIDIEVEGTTQLEGWTFVASLEHLNEGNIVKFAHESESLPEYYRTAPSKCDHCNTFRNRNNTYVIRNDATGEYKQVGNSCLAHFLGGLSAEAYARYLEQLSTITEEGEYKEAISGSYTKYADTLTALSAAKELVRIYGYVKRSPEAGFMCTASLTTAALFNTFSTSVEQELNKNGFHPGAEEVKAYCRTALEWVKTQPEEGDYMRNLKLLCAQPCVRFNNLGILVSLIPVYARALDKELARAKAAPSQWRGDIGGRLELSNVSINLVTSFDTDYGTTYVYKIIEGSDTFIWKTGTNIVELERTERFNIKGTVKEHSEFRDVRQTVLTRCKILARWTAK